MVLSTKVKMTKVLKFFWKNCIKS